MPERRDLAFQVVEIAPAFGLDEEVRASVHKSAVKLCKFLNYQNAGTVEFMVDKNGDFYFLEVNPRIQVCFLVHAENEKYLFAYPPHSLSSTNLPILDLPTAKCVHQTAHLFAL